MKNKMRWLWVGAGVVIAGVAGFGGWVLTRPPAASAATPPAVPPQETAAVLATFAPPPGRRPLIAVIGINDATETTDYITPTGILRRADVADVLLVATGPGPVKLYPALTVEPDTTIADFDEHHADGADYVIVPAMSRDDDPQALQWIRDQAARGAVIIGVCAGAKVVAAAGLLDNKRGTTHWFHLPKLRKRARSLQYVANRRFVADRRVVTTTGITASIPMSLTLIEAIAGRDQAEAVARDIGIDHWDARHASDAFKLTRPFALTVMGNLLAFWKREQLGVQLSPGMDEVSLVLTADAWSRTYRSRALSFADSPGAITTRNGVRIVPDESSHAQQDVVHAFGGLSPAQALNDTLAGIESRYGAATRYVVAMQLEYPQRAATF